MTDWKFKVGDVLEHKASGERCVVTDKTLIKESPSDGVTEFTSAYELDLNFNESVRSYSRSFVEAAYKLVEEAVVNDGCDEEIPVVDVRPLYGDASGITTAYENHVKACNEPKYD